MQLLGDYGDTRELMTREPIEYADSMALYLDYILRGHDDEHGEVSYSDDPAHAMAYRHGRRVLWIPCAPALVWSERYRDAAAAAAAVRARMAE